MAPRAALVVAFAAALAVACGLVHAQPASDDAARLSDAERRRVLQHGPWPPAPARDPSNRVSAVPAAIALGEILFFDPRLSGDGGTSCATCHRPDRDWTDGRARGMGHAESDRNTSSLWNVGHGRWFGWGGAGDSLWAQSVRPILDAAEMGASPAVVAARVRADPELSCRYAAVFGAAPTDMDDDALLVATGKALAAFQETLVSGRTPFDDFRDALARGDTPADAAYPAVARRGLKIFVGRGNCSVCHFGPRFTNDEFADIGMRFFTGPGRVDSGRHAGLAALRANPLNLLGRHNDDATGAAAVKTRTVEAQHRNFGEFKVPGLRNVARTAPYMHAGSIADLRGVVAHYSDIDEDRLHADGERILKPLRLDAGEIDDLLAFLESLNDRRASVARPPPAPCR
ncbi:MAG: cytochrome-c peroxidase [Rhodospirillales bacterium]|nr:MAG: cytochrome-c peroxidase [Rhodospirillales bacterium]